MTTAEAALSMQQTAKKLRAWASKLPPSMNRDDAELFHRAMTREAARLEQDARALSPSVPEVAA